MLSQDEVTILKQARLIKEMTETQGWQEFKKILEAQIAMRTSILMSPFHSLPDGSGYQGMDLAAKAAALESVKGAVIGLRLALSLPDSIIESSKEIMRESRDTEKESA